MQLHRFHAPPATINGESIELDGAESHHLARVLRLREGETVYAFDGVGNEWECAIATSHRTASRLTIIRPVLERVESPLRLTLAQALVKGEKFDLIVQKATELGVAKIVPLVTDFTAGRRSEERDETRSQRWQRIALEAVKQCRRRTLVTIERPVTLAELCRNLNEPAFILSEKGGEPLPATIDPAGALTMLIGPEGGWSAKELALATTNGLLPLHLGPRILRTETAAITAITLAQYRYGDLSQP